MARKTLPAAVVPQEAFELLYDYAHEERISVSEAVRRLLQASPPLIEYAAKRGREVRFEVETWGGARGED